MTTKTKISLATVTLAIVIGFAASSSSVGKPDESLAFDPVDAFDRGATFVVATQFYLLKQRGAAGVDLDNPITP